MSGRVHQEDAAKLKATTSVRGNTVKDGSGTELAPLLDSDGHPQIDVLTGGGAGTQYTEADTDASITGTAVMWEDASDTLRAASAAKPLPTAEQGTPTVVQATAASLKNEPAGNVAADAVDSGNPLKVGGRSVNFDATVPGTATAEADRTDLITDVYGRPFVETAHPNLWDVSADYAAAQTNTSVKATPGVGLSLFITDILISNGAVAGNVTLLDGSGGTVLWEIYPAINGGCMANLRTPIKLTANTALCITSTTVTTHTITICGFIGP